MDVIETQAPGLAFVFRLRLQIGVPLERGTHDGYRHRIMPVLGGTVEGPGFAGVVLGGGEDCQTIRLSDGLARLRATSTLRHEDGTIVSMVNRGVRRGPPEVMARLAAGEPVDPALYYFRCSPSFEVQPGPHGWLAEHAFVCDGRRRPDAVELDIYKVL